MEAPVQTDESSAARISKGCASFSMDRVPASFSKRFQTYLRMKRMLTCRLALLSVTGNGKDIEG